MNITEILSSIDAEIANLEQVRTVLTGIGNGTRAKKGANGRRKRRVPLSRARAGNGLPRLRGSDGRR